MASHFTPRGLIVSPCLATSYNKAHFAQYTPGLTNPKEYETVELMENLFNKVLFRDMDDVTVNSQQPPGLSSKKRCDIVIKYFEHSTYIPKILCFVECKRTSSTQPYKLKDLELQATGYCQDYLNSRENATLTFVYACTAAGAHLRLWRFMRGDTELQGIWGGNGPKEDWNSYKDVGQDDDAALIRKGFESMLALSPNPRAGQTYASYGSQASTGTQPQDIVVGKGKAKAVGSTKPLKEVKVMVYLAEGRVAKAFELDGTQITTWEDDWTKAMFQGKPIWYFAEHNVYSARET